MAAFGLLLAWEASGAAEETTKQFRLGFTAAMFTRINENDAKAAITALGTRIARERNVPFSPIPQLFTSIDATHRAFASGSIDGVGMTLPEFWVLRRDLKFNRYVTALYEGVATENYVLLTRASDKIPDLASLRGRRLSINVTARLSLALTWLDVELVKQGLPCTNRYFSSLAETTKTNKAVLDVYFGQTDACIMSSRILQTVYDLNPNIAKSLHVVASSPPLIPALLVFSDQSDSALCEVAIDEICRLHDTPAGQQILTMMHMVKASEISISVVQPSFDLLDDHARLCPESAVLRTERLQNQRLPSESIE